MNWPLPTPLGSSWQRPQAILRILALLPAFFPSSTAVAAEEFSFSALQGVRWKPKLGDRDEVLGKQPYRGGATTEAATDHIVARGIHYATIDLTPKNKLTKNGMTESEARTWKNRQYDEIALFVNSAKARDIQFFLHARVNEQQEFEDDMVAAIQAIQLYGNGNKIKGIMIGEHEMSDPHNYLQLALNIATNINTRTGGWLKNGKALTLHGGAFGHKFKGIGCALRDTCSPPLGFFSKMSQKVSYFSFAFKYFNPNIELRPSGDQTLKSNWMNYFKTHDDIRLDELESVLNDFKSQYPNHTHCIFVGDAADGLFTIKKKTDDNGTPVGDVIIDALSSIFYNKGWKGFLFGQPWEYRDEISTDDKRGMWNTAFASQLPYSWWTAWRAKMQSTQQLQMLADHAGPEREETFLLTDAGWY